VQGAAVSNRSAKISDESSREVEKQAEAMPNPPYRQTKPGEFAPCSHGLIFHPGCSDRGSDSVGTD
jgi:hypothetical protein